MQQTQSQAASLSWQQKLLSCIKLGVLPASAQLIVQVEYCTWQGRDRGTTLSGSTKVLCAARASQRSIHPCHAVLASRVR